jgi:tetratricopeptide (TPR) repeat protein
MSEDNSANRLDLSLEVLAEIERLCDSGDEAFDAEEQEGAESFYSQAWDLIPEPKINWQVSSSVLAALGDCYGAAGDYEQSAETFKFALLCVGAVKNPYLHFRLAQCLFLLGEHEQADPELLLTLEYGGAELLEETLSELSGADNLAGGADLDAERAWYQRALAQG